MNVIIRIFTKTTRKHKMARAKVRSTTGSMSAKMNSVDKKRPVYVTYPFSGRRFTATDRPNPVRNGTKQTYYEQP